MGKVVNLEMKSTSRNIDGNSDYWERIKFDGQISSYALAVRDLGINGLLEILASRGVNPDQLASREFGNTLYDVWRKPKLGPATLTQATPPL